MLYVLIMGMFMGFSYEVQAGSEITLFSQYAKFVGENSSNGIYVLGLPAWLRVDPARESEKLTTETMLAHEEGVNQLIKELSKNKGEIKPFLSHSMFRSVGVTTYIHLAVIINHPQFVQALLELGAKPNELIFKCNLEALQQSYSASRQGKTRKAIKKSQQQLSFFDECVKGGYDAYCTPTTIIQELIVTGNKLLKKYLVGSDRHADWIAIKRLLLAYGADCADEQRKELTDLTDLDQMSRYLKEIEDFRNAPE